jgi:hypothetical protein
MELTIQLKEMAAQYKALENSHAMYILKTDNDNVTSDTFIRDDYEKDNNDNHSSGNDDSSGWQLQKKRARRASRSPSALRHATFSTLQHEEYPASNKRDGQSSNHVRHK